MKLTKVKRVLTRRLGFLEACLATEPAELPDGRKRPTYERMQEERDALHTVLRKAGLLDEDAVVRRSEQVIEACQPARAHFFQRAVKGVELHQETRELVTRLQGELRAA